MRDQGVQKKPGWSSITVDHGVLHEIAAGDESYPQAEEIFQMWRKLLQKLKIKGYVTKASIVLLVIEENKRRNFYIAMVEKLAVNKITSRGFTW